MSSGLVFPSFSQPNKEGKKQLSDRDILVANITYITFYALSFSIALSINDVSKSIFKSIPGNQHTVEKVTYTLILFGLTIYLAYLSQNLISNVPK